jgi:hypothetical protein
MAVSMQIKNQKRVEKRSIQCFNEQTPEKTKPPRKHDIDKFRRGGGEMQKRRE